MCQKSQLFSTFPTKKFLKIFHNQGHLLTFSITFFMRVLQPTQKNSQIFLHLLTFLTHLDPTININAKHFGEKVCNFLCFENYSW